MKSVKDAFERLITSSPIMLKFALLLEKLAKEVHGLAENVKGLSDAVEAQQELMRMLYLRQSMILKAMEDKSIDLRLPEPKQEKVSKPN